MMSNARLLALRITYLVFPSVFVVLTAFAVLIARGESLPVTYGQVAGYRVSAGATAEDRLSYISAFERALHDERTKLSLPRLNRSGALDRVAQAYAEEMATKRFFDHVSPDGTEPFDRVAIHAPNAIVFGVRENLSYAHTSHPDPVWMRARRAHDALMDSPGHRANIVHKEPTHVGIGMTSIWRDGLLVDYVVQLFAVDAGTWTRSRPRRATEFDRKMHVPVRITRPDVEFLLDRPNHPEQYFTNLYAEGNVRSFFEGSVKLRLDSRGENLELPPLGTGTYTLHARLRGQIRGWYRVLQFEVEGAPRHPIGAP